MTEPSQCPRCGSKDRQYRGDLVAPHWAADDVTCSHPWHTPQPAARQAALNDLEETVAELVEAELQEDTTCRCGHLRSQHIDAQKGRRKPCTLCDCQDFRLSGAPTPVREGAAEFHRQSGMQIHLSRSIVGVEATLKEIYDFAEAFSAHQNAALRKERDALRDALKKD